MAGATVCCAVLLCAACSGNGPRTGTLLTLRYSGEPSGAAITAARSILQNRLRALGLANASIEYEPAQHLVLIRLPSSEPIPESTLRLAASTAELRFRPVKGAIPYAGSSTPATASQAVSSCEHGALVTPRDQDVAAADNVVLPDRPASNQAPSACYVLGPTLLTGTSIETAHAILGNNDQWAVDVKMQNDDFITKVVHPNIGKQIAIVLDGVVQSAPTIDPQNPPTGRDITISGSFTEAEARDLALVLRYGSIPIQLQFVSAAPAR
jgi:preprotein translocase subunit SecD